MADAVARAERRHILEPLRRRGIQRLRFRVEGFDVGAEGRGVVAQPMEHAFDEPQQLGVFSACLPQIGVSLIGGQLDRRVEQLLQPFELVDFHGPLSTPGGLCIG